MYNDRQMKAHFSNITPICYDPKYNRLNEGFDIDLEEIQKILPDKDTLGFIPRFSSQNINLYDPEEPRARFVNDEGRIPHDFTEDIYTQPFQQDESQHDNDQSDRESENSNEENNQPFENEMEPFETQDNQDLEPIPDTIAGTRTTAGTPTQVINTPEVNIPNLDETSMENDMELFDNQEIPTVKTYAQKHKIKQKIFPTVPQPLGNYNPVINMSDQDESIDITNDSIDTSFGELNYQLSNSIRTPPEINLPNYNTFIDTSFDMPNTNFGQLNE